MKIIHSIFLLFPLFFISSCISDTDDIIIEANEVSYSFLSGQKATDLQSSWSANDAIGISAYKSGTNTVYLNCINKKYQTIGNGVFTPATDDDAVFLPLSGSIDFIAYYPHKASISDGYPIDLSDQSSQESLDVLYSDNAKNITRTSEEPGFIFQHLLSRIIVRSKPGNEISENDLAGINITIDNVFNSATLKLRDGSIETSGAKTSIAMNTKTDEPVGEATIFPGTASGVVLTIKLANGNFYKANLPENQLFESGTIYSYNVTVNRTSVILTPAEITDWGGMNDDPNKESATEMMYQTGDFYPNPNDPRTAIGIVYWTKPGSDGREGKIVSFDSGICEWGDSTLSKNINSITNGYFNTTIITAYMSTFPSMKFPAFAWCLNKGSRWYLPSRYELHILQEFWLANEDCINRNIRRIPKEIDTFKFDDVYLSSSECRDYPNTMAEVYSFETKDWWSIDKSTPFRIRAIREF